MDNATWEQLACRTKSYDLGAKASTMVAPRQNPFESGSDDAKEWDRGWEAGKEATKAHMERYAYNF